MSYVRHAILPALGAVTIATLIVATIAIGAQTPPTEQDGVFSDAQAMRGQTLYTQRCAGCHGPKLEGAQAPALTGEAFTAKFRMEPLSALFIQIRYAMPPRTPPRTPPQTPSATPQGTEARTELTNEQGADLVAHILKSNGFPAGKT